MAIYCISGSTLKQLRYEVDKFKSDYKESIEFVGGMLHADSVVKGEQLGKQFRADFSKESNAQGSFRQESYYKSQSSGYTEIIRNVDKALKAAEDLKFSTVSDKGFEFVIDFKKGTIVRKAAFSINDEPEVTFVGFELDVDTQGQKIGKKRSHLSLKAEKIDIDYTRLDTFDFDKELYSNATIENKGNKDFRGRELFRRLLSMLLIPLAIGLMISFTNEGIIKGNPIFVEVLYLYSIFGSITTLFSVKRRFMKNIAPAAIWLVIGILMPTLVISFSGYLAAGILLATIVTISVKDFMYNSFYKQISKDCNANAFAVKVLRLGDIVQIVIGGILAVFATGLVDYKVLSKIYLVFLPIMSILLLLVIFGSLINILKGQYKTVEVALPNMEAQSKHAVASESLDRAIKAYTDQFAGKTYRIQVKQSSLLIKISSNYESGHLSFFLSAVNQPNGNLSDWDTYFYIDALKNQLWEFAGTLGKGALQTLSSKEEFKNYLGSFAVDVTLTELK